MRILAIEDDKPMRELYRRALSQAGHRITTAGSALEALLHIKLDRPDLILLDIGLPGIDGHQLAQSVASDPDVFDIPMAVVSARTDPVSRSWARINGCVGYLEKPFTTTELLDFVREMAKRILGEKEGVDERPA